MTAVRYNLGCVAFNNPEDLRRMISSLEQWNPIGLHRCMLVDHSTECAVRAINYELAIDAGWQYVNQPNRGFGAGVNRLASMSGNETVLVVINLDVSFLETPPFQMMAEAIQKGAFSWVGTSMMNETGARVAGRLPSFGLKMLIHNFQRDLDERSSVGSSWKDIMVWNGAVHGGCFAVRIKDFIDVDGIDEALFLYAEEYDLYLKFLRARRLTGFLVSSAIVHASEGEGQLKKQFLNRYNLRYLAWRENKWVLSLVLTILLSFDLVSLRGTYLMKPLLLANMSRPALLEKLFPDNPPEP